MRDRRRRPNGNLPALQPRQGHLLNAHARASAAGPNACGADPGAHACTADPGAGASHSATHPAAVQPMRLGPRGLVLV